MKKLFHLSTIAILLIACSQNRETSKTFTNELDANETTHELKPKKEASLDTLRDQFHPAFYTDISMREFGLLVMNDSVKPTDNDITFALLDSIKSPAKKDSRFLLSHFPTCC